MSDIEINVNRLMEVHGHLERDRLRLAQLDARLSTPCMGSAALACFQERVAELQSVVDALASRLESDSKAFYELSLQFMDRDTSLAKKYASSIGSSLGGGAE
ncbi:MAG: hypothetical protein HFJ65_02630 [Eggerthellaceae bacterium]|nr:hypothetical protein [Eggerthellaceae bacterium]